MGFRWGAQQGEPSRQLKSFRGASWSRGAHTGGLGQQTLDSSIQSVGSGASVRALAESQLCCFPATFGMSCNLPAPQFPCK